MGESFGVIASRQGLHKDANKKLHGFDSNLETCLASIALDLTKGRDFSEATTTPLCLRLVSLILKITNLIYIFLAATNWFSTCHWRFKAKPVGSLPLQVFPSSAGKTSCTHLGSCNICLDRLPEETKKTGWASFSFFSFLPTLPPTSPPDTSSVVGKVLERYGERVCANTGESCKWQETLEPASEPAYCATWPSFANAPHFHSISAEESR